MLPPNRAGWLEAAGLLFNGGDIDNRQGGIFARDISASSGMVDNRGGLLAASQSLQLDTGGRTLWNADSGDTLGVLSGGKLALSTGDLFNLQDGRIQASTLDINSSTLRNQAGLIMGDTVTLQGDTLDNQAGLIAAKTSLSLVAAQSLHNQGELHSLGDAAVQADTLQQQGGLTTASRNLAVQARQLGSTGQFVAGQDLILNTRQDLTVQAAIQAGRNLVLSTTGKLDSQTVTLPDGRSQQVLVPQVYVKLQQGDLAPSGAILAADRLQLQLKGDLTNQGSIAGRQLLSINADTIHNLAGRLQGGDLAIHANTDLNNQGGRIQADHSLSLSAGRDLSSASTTYSQQHGSGGNTLQQTALDRMAGLYLGQGTGPMLLAAGRNLDLSGSQLSNQSSGSTVLSAGQDLTLGTTDTTQQRRITWNANNWSAQASTDQTGSSTEQAVQDHNNQFATGGQLAMTDLHNQADYNASSSSLNIGTAMNLQGMWSPSGSGIGFGNDSGSASSDTRSGISGIAGNSAARTGDPQSGIRRIFDADKVQQDIDAQTLITQTFGQQASRTIADYAGKQAKSLKAQAGQEADDSKRQALLDESAKWDEGGTYRIAMHSVMGGLLGGVGGAAGAGVAAASAPELNKLQASLTDSLKAAGMPDSAAQVAGSLISAGTAAGMGGALGGMAGAAGGFDVDTNNRQLHQGELDKAKRYGKQFQDFIKRTTGENITEAEAIGRMVRQMERWADYETAKQDGFKVDQQVTSFLGMNSVKVSEADYYNPNINKNVANANQGLISLGQSQSSTGLTPETIEANKNNQKLIALGAAGAVAGPALLASTPWIYGGGVISAGADAGGQYYQNGFVRPEQTAIAGITGGLLTPVGMSAGLLGNMSLGAINGVANTTFQDLYYNSGNPNGSSMLWSAAVNSGFSIAGFKFGSFVGSAIQGVSPVFKPGVSAILQKPNNTGFVYGNILGGVMQNAGVGVEGKSNKSIP